MSTADDGLYRPEYFEQLGAGSRRSARAIVPYVVEFLHPASVIDIGCGVGGWLAAFEECGVSDICGIDGDYIDRSSLLIREDRFVAWDLTRPLQLDRRFDLALSLEVAEHLPPGSAPDFVGSLTSAAPVVLFSAAIPFQKGKGHVNEQWPEYWADMFAAHGYQTCDVLRPVFWTNPEVEWWYAQNVLIYADRDALERYPVLRRHERGSPLPLVHPRRYLELVEWIRSKWSE